MNNFALVNLKKENELPTMGGFNVLCRQPDPGCDFPYAKRPESYEGAMLRSGFHKFGLGLQTILKQHKDH